MLHLIPFSPSNFGRYVSQTESNPEESMNINDWSPGSPSITTELPSLLSFSAVPAADLPDHNGTKTSLITSSLVTEDVEQIPYLHHAPGPIQRPTKLNPPAAPSNSALRTVNTLQSPSTPDVLDQINHLIYENTTSTAGTVTNNPNSSTVSSPLINDLTTANLAWPFPANEWSTKLEPSWSYSSLQSPTISLSSAMPNPFALLSQTSRGEPPLWSSGTVGAAAPPYSLSASRVQRVAGWTDFSSTTPASASPGPQQMPGNPWAKYMTTHVSSTTNATAGNPPFWTLPSMSTDSVVPTMSQMQPGPSTQIWWTGLSSDENNNTDGTTDDNATTRDQSRWDFAR